MVMRCRERGWRILSNSTTGRVGCPRLRGYLFLRIPERTMKLRWRTLAILSLLAAPLIAVACSDSPTAAVETQVGRSKKLYADGDCSWSPNCDNSNNAQWIREWTTTADYNPFDWTWFNRAYGAPCTTAGCSQDCWNLVARCVPIFPPIDGQTCSTAICGLGSDGGGAPCDYNPSPGVIVQCNTKFSKEERRIIELALNRFTRQSNQFSDTTAARECEEMKTWVLAAIVDTLHPGAPPFGKGTSNSPSHWGGENGGYAHVDPRILSDAQAHPGLTPQMSRLAAEAMHEVAHLHHVGNDHDGDAPTQRPYSNDYFRFLNVAADYPSLPSSTFNNQCVKY